MAYALHSASFGTFIGFAMGLAFFSKLETVGQTTAATCRKRDEAETLIRDLGDAAPADIEIREVISGHWTHLRASGLDYGDMDRNQMLHAPVQGVA